MNTLKDLPEMTLFFSSIFDFLHKYRIHSFIDHMSDYSQLYEIVISSQLKELRYSYRMDQYSFTLRNENNRLVDLVYLFCFGGEDEKINSQQIMITLNNEKIRVEIIITDNRELPVMKYCTQEKKLNAFLKRKEPARDRMTQKDWELFLESHCKQYPHRMK